VEKGRGAEGVQNGIDARDRGWYIDIMAHNQVETIPDDKAGSMRRTMQPSNWIRKEIYYPSAFQPGL
jgi:hypothetical protein